MAALLYAQTQLPAQRGTHLAARRQTALCSAMAVRLSAEWCNDEPFVGFRNGEATAFLNQFAEGNARVAHDYLHRDDGRLFDDERVQELPDGMDDAVVLTPTEIARVNELIRQLKVELAEIKA